METGEGGGDGWGSREKWGGKGRKLYLNDNKIQKYLIKKKETYSYCKISKESGKYIRQTN